MNRKFITLIIISVFLAFNTNAQITSAGISEIQESEIPVFTVSEISKTPEKGIIFEDDFSTDKGWTGYAGWSWQRGAAVAGGSYGGDPATDHTATDDNYLVGTTIGGDPTNSGANMYLNSPLIDCSGHDDVYLKFWSHSYAGEANVYQVWISQGNTCLYNFTMSGSEETEWTKHIFNISELVGNQSDIFIRFRYYIYELGFPGLSIDDVSIIDADEHDLGTELITPEYVKQGNSPVPQVTVFNYGISDENPYDIQLVINDGTANVYNETINVTDTVFVGESAIIDMPAWATSAEGVYNMTATVTLSGDENLDNDVTTQTCNVYSTPEGVLFEDDFSTDIGWTYEGTWERAVATAGGSGGGDPTEDHTATSDEYLLGTVVGGDVPINMYNNIITSPAIDCSGQDVVNLNLWSNSEVGPNNRFRIYISNDGIDWHDYIDSVGINETQWNKYSYNISEHAAGYSSVYIKLLYSPVNGEDAHPGMSIDDISLSYPELIELAVENIDPFFVQYNTSTIPKVTIYNNGAENIAGTDYEIQLIIKDSNEDIIYDETVISSNSIPILSNTEIDMPEWTPPLSEGDYDMTASVTIAGDNFPENDTLTTVCYVADYTPFYLWNIFNNGDDIQKGPVRFYKDNGAIVSINANYDNLILGAEWANGLWYACDGLTGEFVTIDTETGDVTPLGLLINPEEGISSGLAYDEKNDIMYALISDPPNSNLYAVDIHDGSSTIIGTITDETLIISITCDNEGNIWGLDQNNSSLISIDPITAEQTIVGELGSGIFLYAAQDIAYDKNNSTLYGMLYNYLPGQGNAFSSFYEISVNSGLAGSELYRYMDEMAGFAIPYTVKTVTFTVDDGTNPIEGALIEIINGESYTTNVDGVVTFDVVEEQSYTYTVSREECSQADGVFNLNEEDQDISVHMTCASSVVNEINSEINIFPNPTKGKFVITVDNNYKLEVVDITGKIIYTQELTQTQTDIDLSAQVAGVYFIRLTNNEKTYNYKIVVK